MSDASIEVPVEDPLQMAWFECNDFGNGRRLELLSKGLLKWVDDKAWIAFDGRRWSEREGGYRARALAHEVAAHIHQEAAALGELIGSTEQPNENALQERFGDWCTGARAVDRLSMLHKHAIKSGNAAQTAAMLTQAKDMAGMRAWGEDFDIDPLAFNCLNGTGRFKLDGDGNWYWHFTPGHEPTDMIRQIADVEYLPDATCPQWEGRFVILQPDEEQRAILPLLYGQSMTGLTDGEEFYVHQGQGGDGKSKTHEALADVFGDYWKHSPVKTWLAASFQKSGSEHRSDLVRLAGDIRFITSEEPPKSATWDGEILKQWTGGGNITARGSGAKEEITYKPRGKLHVELNKLLAVPGDDKGFRRRLRIIQWPVDTSKLPGGAEPPAELMARLMTEKEGILNWLIKGACAWLAVRKLPVPTVMQNMLDNFWSEASPLSEWLTEQCDLSDPEAQTGSTALYKAFKGWCEQQEHQHIWSQTKFGREMTDRQLLVVKDRNGNKVRRGIKLRTTDPFDGQMGGNATAAPSPAPTDREWAERTGHDDGDIDDFLGGNQ